MANNSQKLVNVNTVKSMICTACGEEVKRGTPAAKVKAALRAAYGDANGKIKDDTIRDTLASRGWGYEVRLDSDYDATRSVYNYEAAKALVECAMALYVED